LYLQTQVSTGSTNLAGWWLTYPSEKYEGQLGLLFPIFGQIENVLNHQPVRYLLEPVAASAVLVEAPVVPAMPTWRSVGLV